MLCAAHKHLLQRSISCNWPTMRKLKKLLTDIGGWVKGILASYTVHDALLSCFGPNLYNCNVKAPSKRRKGCASPIELFPPSLRIDEIRPKTRH
jgi:hypothetical protein